MASDENGYQRIARRVTELRVRKGMSQEELAERMGILPVSVKNFESGKTVLRLRRMFQLREIFGCTLNDFFEDAPGGMKYPEVEKYSDVGRRVLSLRRSRGMTQTAVAGHLGITTANLSSVEHGRVELTIKNLLRLRELFGCTVRDFLEEVPIAEKQIKSRPYRTELEHAYHEIGRRIRALRAAKNMSMTELSKRTGVDLGNMSKIENGVGTLALNTLFKMRKVLGCTMRDFFEDGKEVPTRPPAQNPSDNTRIEYQKIGERIRAISVDRNISQAELAQRMGIHLLSLHKIERGQQHPPLKRLLQMSEILRCSVSDFFEIPTKEDRNAAELEYQKIGERIRNIREGRGKKPASDELETIVRIENGIEIPTLETLYRIRKVLGCTMRDFFEERPQKKISAEKVVQVIHYMKKIKRAETIRNE